MATYLMAVPIVQGKTDIWKNYLKEIAGPRNEDYKKSRKNLGVKIEQVFLQQTPYGDMVVVRWECDNPEKALEKMAKSQDPFDIWFRDKILTETLGLDASQPMPINQQFHDYQEVPAQQYAETKKGR